MLSLLLITGINNIHGRSVHQILIKQQRIHHLKVKIFITLYGVNCTRLGTKVHKILYVLTAHPQSLFLESFSTCTSSWTWDDISWLWHCTSNRPNASSHPCESYHLFAWFRAGKNTNHINRYRDVADENIKPLVFWIFFSSHSMCVNIKNSRRKGKIDLIPNDD